MRKSDVVASVVIGEAAGLLMLAIGRNIELPSGPAGLLVWLPFVFPPFTLFTMAAGSFVGRRIPVAYQFSKFLLVGGFNFLIDLGVLNLLIYWTDIASGFYATTFKAAAFLTAVSSSFFWNKFWTFRAGGSSGAALQFTEFLVVSVIGFFLNVGLFAFFNDFVGPRAGIDQTTWATVSAFLAALTGLFWNFVGYKFFVFRRVRA
jgi:putative flippase GtrA